MSNTFVPQLTQSLAVSGMDNSLDLWVPMMGVFCTLRRVAMWITTVGVWVWTIVSWYLRLCRRAIAGVAAQLLHNVRKVSPIPCVSGLCLLVFLLRCRVRDDPCCEFPIAATSG